jgi:hypothetical protein
MRITRLTSLNRRELDTPSFLALHDNRAEALPRFFATARVPVQRPRRGVQMASKYPEKRLTQAGQPWADDPPCSA